MKKLLAAIALLVALAAPAFAQTSPNLRQGQVLTPAQWNALFTAKQDWLGANPLLVTGGTLTGKLTTNASALGSAGFALPPGTAPTSPLNGDVWLTSSSIFARINGVTYDLVNSTCANCALTNAANIFTASPQLVQGLTTTSPGWYAQLTGDTVPRVRVGLNALDVASIGFGSGSATRDTFIERVGAGSLRFGAADAASPVAQTLSVQNVLAGTVNTAGVNFIIQGSLGTGTGAGGGIFFQVSPAGSSGSGQNALQTALSIFSDKAVSIGGAADKGTGTFNAAGLIYSNANAVAASASLPVVLNATTGGLTCPTCVTSSGGGAITGTSPVVVSAAGAVSVQGAIGSILVGQGAGSIFTAHPQLGVAGTTLGALDFANVTSGLITLTPPSGALGSVTNTLQAVTDTFVYKATTDTLTNKTLVGGGTNTIGGVNMTLGSDATGDIYYRSAGVLTRLPIGSNGNVLGVTSGLPAWQAGSSAGSVTIASTTIAGGATNNLLFNNAGVLANGTIASFLSNGAGISITGTTTATIAANLSFVANSLGSNTTIANGSYTDGPSTAQGTTGVWKASGTVTVGDSVANVGACKLWDGTNAAVDSANFRMPSTAAAGIVVALSGVVSSPAGNIRISCTSNDSTATMRFNDSGNSKDSTLTVVRIQ